MYQINLLFAQKKLINDCSIDESHNSNSNNDNQQ